MGRSSQGALAVAAACAWLAGGCSAGCGSGEQVAPMTLERLGALLFDDPRLSEPEGQACSDCHAASVAFADPEDERSSEGAVRGRFALRNAQSAMYARFVPPLHSDPATGGMVGGLFWDGRASTLEDQAALPLLNPLEMNNPDKASVVAKVRAGHARAFRDVFGPGSLDDVDQAFARITEALAAFQRTPAFSPFASRYDRYLAGEIALAPDEARGLASFEDPARGNCASCHPSRPAADGTPPMFTTFAYVNLGVPRFQDSRFYQQPAALNPAGERFVDLGLAVATGDPRHAGMFRIPSLRNVARTTPYGHNGYFRRLDEMIAFHAGFASQGPCPPDGPSNAGGSGSAAAPEVPSTVQRPATGCFTPSPRELADLIAFLRTLTDASIEAIPVQRSI
jgi:cytochrome c peroxidase